MICSSRSDNTDGIPVEMLRVWHPTLALTCMSEQHIYIWAVERASQRVVINHGVISLQPSWKWDIIKKMESDLEGSAAQLLTQ